MEELRELMKVIGYCLAVIVMIFLILFTFYILLGLISWFITDPLNIIKSIN